ncbi:hypothetical protein SAMN04489761_2946 [Tenacibaculum sp. MAR_2009_124]|uniref:hypothetical protein n=1 Tax=Tenacibaculum sp. MAR_2009_124 TaxID=1250059 RepID=UPI00089807EF|nr:hypothetical protein [Tenacibaculum sp. MAR_2009_124]SEC42120.1 hypothetical protein SAMN04489761_2946 [Tenacibaculum sp. MAR_2009_124]
MALKKLVIILFISASAFAQTGVVDILQADSTWTKEKIKIPFHFAPEIKYEGYEDIRFAKGWGNIESSEFWTYSFVWNINLKDEPKTSFFEENLKFHFDGLMNLVNKEKDKVIPKTQTKLYLSSKTEKTNFYQGTLVLHDSFKTKNLIVLYVNIESKLCKKTNNYLLLFRFSHQPFQHSIWEKMKLVKIKKEFCG